MNVVVSINGRDALPVWSIPYVTSGHISADMLLKRLEDPKYTTPSFPTAFNLDSDKVSLIPKEWWSETKYQLDLLDEELGLTSADRDEWRIRSVTIIMQNRGCYIWLDEFKNWFDKRSIGCSHIGLYLTPTLSPEHQLHFKNTEPKKLKAKAPLDKHDEELQFKKEIANNRLSLCLPEFIELLPVDVSEHNSRFPAFYRLVEEYGLVVHDKTVDGQIVSSFELLEALRQRDQQAYDSLDDYDFDFWEALIKERKYNVERDDVATAYEKAGKTAFPWLSIVNNSVSLNTEEHTKADNSDVFGITGFGKLEIPKNATENIEDDTDDTYKQRINSFNSWLKCRGIDHTKPEALELFLNEFRSVKNIFEALAEARKDDINTYGKAKGKDKPLWGISFATFNSKEFWSRYCRDVGYKRKGQIENRQ